MNRQEEISTGPIKPLLHGGEGWSKQGLAGQRPKAATRPPSFIFRDRL
jgi:hypothetical protein